MIDAVYRAVERHPRDLMFASSVADIRLAKRLGKVACLMGIEGGHAIEDSLPTLREFYRLGVRYMTLTWNNTHNWADAGRGEKKHNGLNEFGQEVVREMNRLGMLVDVSHVSDETMSDVLDISSSDHRFAFFGARSQQPAAKHSRRSFETHRGKRRCGPCQLLQRVRRYQYRYSAKSGARSPVESAAGCDRREIQKRSRAPCGGERQARASESIAAAADLETDRPLRSHRESRGNRSCRHRADFDGANDMPEGAKDVSMLPNITYELLKRGYSERDIRKVLGEHCCARWPRLNASRAR